MKDRSRQEDLSSFSKFLAKEFSERKSKNKSYSIRSFSKFLDMDQSLLSKVLSGKSELSQKSVIKCLVALKVPESEMGRYLKDKSLIKITYTSVEEDVFSLISEWYHFAILELFKTKNFVFDIQYIADQLNLSLEETQKAVNRLISFEFITLKKGKWVLNKANNFWSSYKTTSEPKKVLQKKLLEKSIVALENVDFNLRDHGSFTVAVDRRRLPEFKEKLQEFRRQLGDFFQNEGELDSVYQLTISFYPLTKQESQL